MNYKINTQIRLEHDVPEDAVLGWHFIQPNKQLRYGDGREVVVGESLTVKGMPEIGSHGLHACMHLDTAYHYRPDFSYWCCFVWVRGQFNHSMDGLFCGQQRGCIGMVEWDVFFSLWCQYQDDETALHNQMYAGELTDAQHRRARWKLMNKFETDMLKAMGVIKE